jgi:DNA-binding LacI/PurR family transcriptional regulator
VPDAIGRSLTAGRTRAIQLLTLTSDLHTDTVRKTSLFYYIIEGVLAVASLRNYGVRFDVKSHEDPGLTEYVERLVGGGTVDSIAIIPQFHRANDFMHAIFRDRFPCMLLQPARFAPGANFADMGNYAGGIMAAGLFASAGAKRVAFINGPQLRQ